MIELPKEKKEYCPECKKKVYPISIFCAKGAYEYDCPECGEILSED